MGNNFFIHVYPVKVNGLLHFRRKKLFFLDNSNGKDRKMHFDSCGAIAVIFYIFLSANSCCCLVNLGVIVSDCEA